MMTLLLTCPVAEAVLLQQITYSRTVKHPQPVSLVCSKDALNSVDAKAKHARLGQHAVVSI